VRNALSLCLQVVIPSLFPFFVLSTLINECGVSEMLSRLFTPLMARLFHLSGAGASAVVLGMIGGYPVGAQCINQAYFQGSLSKEDAERMLAFCNNCGPAFLFGIVSLYFDDHRTVWILWGIHVLSALLVAMSMPGRPGQISLQKHGSMSVSQALIRTLSIMAQICGWVVLFRILITFFGHWFGFHLSQTAQVAVSGLLELANGCLSLAEISNTGERFIICSALISLGGLCVTMQTFGLLHKDIDKRLYLPGKILQCAYSIIIAIALNASQLRSGPMLVISITSVVYIVLFFIFSGKVKNSSSILRPTAV